jgi:glycosyltransferase involved in cell wall biosynthesis
MNNKPLVSVIIPTYNSEKYIKESLESIINQTYDNLEVVVTDDCSKDNTVDMVKKYQSNDSRIRLIVNKKNMGIALNMNKGIRVCKGKYIAILDADDWAYPYRVEEQVKVMEENPDVVLCSGYMQICDENLNIQKLRTYPLTDKDIRRTFMRYDPIPHPASMWRKDQLLKTSLYNNNFPICRDVDMKIRISEFGKYQNIPKALIKYRVRKDSETGKRIRQTQWYTFYLQMKAHFEYGFTITFGDVLFIIGRLIATVILPVSLQRSIANNFNYRKKDEEV